LFAISLGAGARFVQRRNPLLLFRIHTLSVCTHAAGSYYFPVSSDYGCSIQPISLHHQSLRSVVNFLTSEVGRLRQYPDLLGLDLGCFTVSHHHQHRHRHHHHYDSTVSVTAVELSWTKESTWGFKPAVTARIMSSVSARTCYVGRNDITYHNCIFRAEVIGMTSGEGDFNHLSD
jgi:hypothetical protein